MDIKKCKNCGAFMMSDGDLCESCAKELAYQNTVLKNYFDENVSFDSIASISSVTGVDSATIQNYMKSNNYTDSDIDDSTFNSILF